MNNLWIWVVVIVIVVGGFIWWQSAQAPTVDQGAGSASQTVSGDSTAGAQQPSSNDTSGTSVGVGAGVSVGSAPMTATVTYTSSGFSPSPVTIAKGGTVTFVDQGGQPMWVASNAHPVHSGYDGTSRGTHCAAGYIGEKPFDECGSGSSYSFTFGKTGTWGYHNHIGSEEGGTVVVQ